MAPSFRNLDAKLAQGTMTTGEFTSFIIFTLLYLPLIWIKPEHYKIPSLVCCGCIIPTVFILLIWFTAAAKGGGDLLRDVSAVAGVTQARGTHLAWMLVLGICTNISSISVHLYVQSDYTRYARKPRDQILAQLVMVPSGTIIVALIGIICTSCGAKLFPEQAGTLLWEPYRLLDALQVHYGDSSGSRAAVFFAALAFMVAQFAMVVANNGLSGGMDISSLLPRYFTIRRGMLLLACVSFITQPWQLLNGASKFLTVLGGYGVFLGPMTGVMFSDYFLVRQRVYKLTDLFLNSPDGIYYFNRGMNWRALVAWAMGVWITLPGFARQVQGGEKLAGWTDMYYIAWPLGTTLSLITYYVLHLLSPMPGIGLKDETDFFGVDSPYVIEGEDGSLEEIGIDTKKA
jgi:NCS1 family nucleobase:cation symporter-1